MRILGFSRKWDKLKNDTFTTFRFKRRDADWFVGEVVQVVYKPRSKKRDILGTAEIICKEPRGIVQEYNLDAPKITEQEAKEDGFTDFAEMYNWLAKAYGFEAVNTRPMNKLTLRRILYEQNV